MIYKLENFLSFLLAFTVVIAIVCGILFIDEAKNTALKVSAELKDFSMDAINYGIENGTSPDEIVSATESYLSNNYVSIVCNGESIDYEVSIIDEIEQTESISVYSPNGFIFVHLSCHPTVTTGSITIPVETTVYGGIGK